MTSTAISAIDVARQNIGAYKGELLAALPPICRTKASAG